jgi:hypothetical protein
VSELGRAHPFRIQLCSDVVVLFMMEMVMMMRMMKRMMVMVMMRRMRME